jgi:hypothetical protein
MKGRGGEAFNLVAKQALSERSEDILFSDRLPAEGFLTVCGQGVAKHVLHTNDTCT